jgi:hypothetical protein
VRAKNVTEEMRRDVRGVDARLEAGVSERLRRRGVMLKQSADIPEGRADQAQDSRIVAERDSCFDHRFNCCSGARGLVL